MVDSAEDWARLYRTLSGLGLAQPQVPYQEQLKPGKPTLELPIAWPDLKVAIGFDSSPNAEFEKAGWTIVRMSSSAAKAMPAALLFIDEVAFGYALRKAEAEAEQTISKTEQTVLEAVMRAGLPTPNRNFEVVNADGRLLTVPDFAWHDVKLAVFVDGHHWHGGKSLLELMEQVSNDPRRQAAVKQRWKNKSAQDADARRFMSADGWTVLAVSDKTVDDGPQAVSEAVQDIVATYKRLQQGQGQGTSA